MQVRNYLGLAVLPLFFAFFFFLDFLANFDLHLIRCGLLAQ